MEGRVDPAELAENRGEVHNVDTLIEFTTPENINDVINSQGLTRLEIVVYMNNGEMVRRFVEMGAYVTVYALIHSRNVGTLCFLLEHGGDPNALTKRGFSVFDYLDTMDGAFQTLMDYGGHVPLTWKLNTHQFSYVEHIGQRERNCRRTLVAMLYYCKRCAYPALRAGYRDLAKWVLRMRGPAGCGPRSYSWFRN